MLPIIGLFAGDRELFYRRSLAIPTDVVFVTSVQELFFLTNRANRASVDCLHHRVTILVCGVSISLCFARIVHLEDLRAGSFAQTAADAHILINKRSHGHTSLYYSSVNKSAILNFLVALTE